MPNLVISLAHTGRLAPMRRRRRRPARATHPRWEQVMSWPSGWGVRGEICGVQATPDQPIP